MVESCWLQVRHTFWFTACTNRLHGSGYHPLPAAFCRFRCVCAGCFRVATRMDYVFYGYHAFTPVLYTVLRGSRGYAFVCMHVWIACVCAIRFTTTAPSRYVTQVGVTFTYRVWAIHTGLHTCRFHAVLDCAHRTVLHVLRHGCARLYAVRHLPPAPGFCVWFWVLRFACCRFTTVMVLPFHTVFLCGWFTFTVLFWVLDAHWFANAAALHRAVRGSFARFARRGFCTAARTAPCTVPPFGCRFCLLLCCVLYRHGSGAFAVVLLPHATAVRLPVHWFLPVTCPSAYLPAVCRVTPATFRLHYATRFCGYRLRSVPHHRGRATVALHFAFSRTAHTTTPRHYCLPPTVSLVHSWLLSFFFFFFARLRLVVGCTYTPLHPLFSARLPVLPSSGLPHDAFHFATLTR